MGFTLQALVYDWQILFQTNRTPIVMGFQTNTLAKIFGLKNRTLVFDKKYNSLKRGTVMKIYPQSKNYSVENVTWSRAPNVITHMKGKNVTRDEM